MGRFPGAGVPLQVAGGCWGLGSRWDEWVKVGRKQEALLPRSGCSEESDTEVLC